MIPPRYYENEPRKRKLFLIFWEIALMGYYSIGIPKYDVDCGDITLKEKEEIWKRANKAIRGE